MVTLVPFFVEQLFPLPVNHSPETSWKTDLRDLLPVFAIKQSFGSLFKKELGPIFLFKREQKNGSGRLGSILGA